MRPWDSRPAAIRTDQHAGALTAALIAGAGAALITFLTGDGVSWTAVIGFAFAGALFHDIGAQDAYDSGYGEGFRAGAATAPTVGEVLFAAELEGLTKHTKDDTERVERRLERTVKR